MLDRARALLFVAALLGARAALAAPPIDMPSPPTAASLRQPLRVPIATCAPADSAPPADLSASALLDELKRMHVRLDELARRKAELKAAQADLEGQRRALAAEWERLEAERVDLDLARAEMSGPAKVPQDSTGAEAAKVAGLVKQMKPAKAAELLARIDPSLAVEVMGRLSPKLAAGLLERLPPEQAARITSRLALKDPSEGAL